MKSGNNKQSGFSLSPEGTAFVKKEMTRYETKRSALLPCLYRVQKENGGWISEEAVSYLSEVMAIPTAQIKEVLSFYTLYNTRPVGRWHIQVCHNLSCAMNGAKEVITALCRGFNVREGELSPDGDITISRVECLGACDQAPVAQINDNQYIGPLKEDSVVESLKTMIKNQN